MILYVLGFNLDVKLILMKLSQTVQFIGRFFFLIRLRPHHYVKTTLFNQTMQYFSRIVIR